MGAVLLLFSSYRGPFSPCRGYFCGLTSSYENFSLDMRMHWFRVHTGCHTGSEFIPEVTLVMSSYRMSHCLRVHTGYRRTVLEMRVLHTGQCWSEAAQEAQQQKCPHGRMTTEMTSSMQMIHKSSSRAADSSFNIKSKDSEMDKKKQIQF